MHQGVMSIYRLVHVKAFVWLVDRDDPQFLRFGLLVAAKRSHWQTPAKKYGKQSLPPVQASAWAA